MIRHEHDVPYGDGAVRVREYEGSGPAVFLVHGAGFCALCWDQLVPLFEGRLHPFAIDLPGHGASRARMRRPSDAWQSIIAATKHLELASPLLVGLNAGGQACLFAAAEHRDAYAGVVTLGGACVRSRTSAEDDVAFYTSESFKEVLRQRFFFGSTGTDQRDIEHLVDKMSARLPSDWRVQGCTGLLEEVRYSIRPRRDGEDGWVHLPLPDTITTMLTAAPTDRLYPDESIYRRIDVPVRIVQLTEGLDQGYAEREREMAARNPRVSIRTLDTGDYPHYTRPEETAAILLETCGVAPQWDVQPVHD
ncbi:MAG: alpha/beta hydrolase [Mobilicoccus sp.]|nr:alpha/beta hydrolase [Mobilicoccus sp.]